MDFGTAVKYVLAVIGIMAVLGGIIFALSGVVLNAFEKRNKTPQVRQQKAVEKQAEPLLLEDSKPEVVEEQPVVEEKELKEATEVEGEGIDLDLANEEEKAILAQRNELAERERVVEEAQNFEENEDNFEDEDINDIYQRMIAEINAEATDEEDEEMTDEEIDQFISELQQDDEDEEVVEEPQVDEVEKGIETVKEVINEVVEEQPVEEEVVEEEQEEVNEEPVEVEEVNEVVEEIVEEQPVEEVNEEPQVDKEKEELRQLVEELKQQLAKEQEEKETLAQAAKEVEVVDSESIESLNDRLAVLTERLSQSEKDLKANKKEYLPLKRIQKTLENDKAKLRRKEAIVAKQKVVLFGVNNYVVDPEKEKKLNEDLDLLDALRLSVQHCEEVIKDNEDRYPILEKTYNILTKQIENLKADIADVKARIDAKTTNNDDDTTNE